MKKLLNIFSMLPVASLIHAQTTSENYRQTRTYLEPVTATSSAAKQLRTVEYFDGLGRLKQIVNVKATPNNNDIVTPIVYDSYGLQTKSYLPIPKNSTSDGNIYPQDPNSVNFPVDDITNFYQGEKIYSEDIIESSPLRRIQQTKQVGEAWSSKPINFQYETNTINDAVKSYDVTTTWDPSNKVFANSTPTSQTYPINMLYKNSIKDEDGNEIITFKNKQGQIVLSRKIISITEKADTYYIYNKYNQLVYVIPPLASVVANIDGAILSDLCYQYKYDDKNRLVEKNIPGKGVEYMVYDKTDRLILTQDANLRDLNRWLLTKYDQFGRVAYTGLLTTNNTRKGMQDQITDSVVTESRNTTGFTINGITVYYTNVYFGLNTMLSVNYYDTYPSYDFNPTFPTDILGEPTLTDDASIEGKSTKGLPVMNLVKNIEDDNWTKNYIYYDKKKKIIGAYSINHLGGYTETKSKLDFSGFVQQSVTRHKRLNTDNEKVITENFTYDSQNRLLTHKHKVDNNPEEILTQNTYNELSQLSGKKVGGTSASTPLQDISYAYNIRGWMTKINDPKNLNEKLFGYEIKYNQVEGEETPDPLDTSLKVLPKFNGNIAEVDWRTNTVQNDFLRRYGYVYDKLNRLSAGFYQRDDHPSANEYYEKVLYDLNGNITNLKRTASLDGNTAAGLIDNLSYEYFNSGQSNRLNKIIEQQQNPSGYPYEAVPTAIIYDNNGNMTINADKGLLGISYNYLNLPNSLIFKKGLSTRTGIIRENTKYLYRADGVKIRKTYNYAPSNPLGTITSLSAKVTEYLDSFQYESLGGKVTGALALQFVPTPEGYFDFQKNKYIYNYTDHLGNTRLSYFHNGSGIEVLEENNYYPFGMKHEGYNPLAGNPTYQYKYNGKELQTESGMYDYGARFYMPDIGRWGVVDPLAEVSPDITPYRYGFNNPISFTDPTGMYEDGYGGGDYYDDSDRGQFDGYFDFGFHWTNTDPYGSTFDNIINFNWGIDFLQSGWHDSSNSINSFMTDISDINSQTMENDNIGLNSYEQNCCPDKQDPSVGRKSWNFLADNIISKPIEGIQFLGYFFYGIGQVPGEMYRQGRMENIHVTMDMTLWGFTDGAWGRTMKYKDGVTVMTEKEKYEKMAIPAIETMTLGVGFGFKPFQSGILNWGFNTGVKTGVKKSIYQLVPTK